MRPDRRSRRRHGIGRDRCRARRRGSLAADLFSTARAFLDEPFISVEPLDAERAVAAGDAYRRYGKGHRASIWAMSSPTCLPGGGISRCCPRRGFHSRRYRRSLSKTVFGPKLKVCEPSGEVSKNWIFVHQSLTSCLVLGSSWIRSMLKHTCRHGCNDLNSSCLCYLPSAIAAIVL